MIRSAVCIGSLLLSTMACAANWAAVGYATGGNPILSVDRSSIVRVGSSVKYWTKQEYAQSQLLENTYPAKYYSSAKALVYTNCASKTTATKQGTFYDTNGEPVYSYNYQFTQLSFSEVIPDSIGESELNFVCRQGVTSAHHKRIKSSIQNLSNP